MDREKKMINQRHFGFFFFGLVVLADGNKEIIKLLLKNYKLWREIKAGFAESTSYYICPTEIMAMVITKVERCLNSLYKRVFYFPIIGIYPYLIF